MRTSAPLVAVACDWMPPRSIISLLLLEHRPARSLVVPSALPPHPSSPSNTSPRRTCPRTALGRGWGLRRSCRPAAVVPPRLVVTAGLIGGQEAGGPVQGESGHCQARYDKRSRPSRTTTCLMR